MTFRVTTLKTVEGLWLSEAWERGGRWENETQDVAGGGGTSLCDTSMVITTLFIKPHTTLKHKDANVYLGLANGQVMKFLPCKNKY